VKHDRCQVRPAIELRYERIRRVALVDYRGEPFAGGDLELSAKGPLLGFDTGGGSGKIEACFPERNRSETFDRAPQVTMQRAVVLLGKLWVQADGEIDIGMSFPQRV
jgi:hypothetical protein